MSVPGFQTRGLRREGPRWVRAIAAAARGENAVPFTLPSTAPPPLKAWESKRPENLALFTEVRQAIDELSEELNIPAQNLITTDYVRRLCWEPPARFDEQTLRDALAEFAARTSAAQTLEHVQALEVVLGNAHRNNPVFAADGGFNAQL